MKWQQHVKKRKAVSCVGFRCDSVNIRMSTLLASSKRADCGGCDVLLEVEWSKRVVLECLVSSESPNRFTTAVVSPLWCRSFPFHLLQQLGVMQFYFKMVGSGFCSPSWVSVCVCVCVCVLLVQTLALSILSLYILNSFTRFLFSCLSLFLTRCKLRTRGMRSWTGI